MAERACNWMEEFEAILKCKPTPKPESPDSRAVDQKLALRFNVVYIVAAVLLDGDKVLLIQEAKPSCRGEWYLPAGRMEANETFVEAAKREVEEESGLTFEPQAVIAVESMSHQWIRVTMTGQVTGGQLKTTAQADKESLQARWFSQDELRSVHLRARDICPLIEAGRRWAGGKRYGGLPVLVGHVSSTLRLILATHDGSHLLVLVRAGEGGTTHFPIASTDNHLEEEVRKCGYKGGFKISGVLSVEHLGKPHGSFDGICLSLLLKADAQTLDSKSKYKWSAVDKKLEQTLQNALDNHCAELLSHKLF